MKRSRDLTDIFNEWDYEEDDNVRFITGEDGREIMQIRQPLGIEQYDLDGRPDGKHPEGMNSVLDFYLSKAAKMETGGGSPALNDKDFQLLQEEGILFYNRYLALFQVGFYDRVARDAEHNLKICRLLEDRYPDEKRFEILQYRPYIIRMNSISRAMLKLADDDAPEAAVELEKGKADITTLPVVPTPIFEFEKIRSLQHLSQVLAQVKENIDEEKGEGIKGFKERLTEELSKAIDNEDYERAARLRDRLQGLN